jgi:hypothetical protein
VVIAGHRLRTGAGPFHRPPGLFGGQHQCQEFRVDLVPDSEGAADIDGADAEPLRAEAGDVRERGLDIRGPLARQAKLERFARRVVAGDAGFWLHRVACDPLRAQADPHDMRRLGKSRLGARPIAVFIVQCQVVRQFLVQADGAVRDRLAGLDHDRQVFVFDPDELGRVLRQRLRESDHERHGFADKTDTAMRQPSAKRDAQRAAADPFEEGRRRRSLPARGDGVGRRHHIQDTGQLARLVGVDAQDFCMRAIGAQEMPTNLAADVVIGCVATPARDQSKVFATAPELIFRQMQSDSFVEDRCRSPGSPTSSVYFRIESVAKKDGPRREATSRRNHGLGARGAKIGGTRPRSVQDRR